MKSKGRISLVGLITVLLAASIILAGCGKKPETAQPVNAGVATDTSVISAFGVIKTVKASNITLNFPVVISEVFVQDGQRVDKGSVLAVLDMTDYFRQVKNKETEFKVIREEIQKQQGELEKLTNEISVAETDYNYSLTDLAVKEQLKDAGAVPVVEFYSFKNAVTAKEKVLQNLKVSANNIQENDIPILQHKMAILDEELAQMRRDIETPYFEGNHLILPMEDGVVDNVNVKAGDRLLSGQSIMTISDLDTLVVEADIAEEFIKDVKVGASVSIIPVSDRNKMLSGTVRRISNKAVEKKGETIIPVEISCDSGASQLMPGLNVDVEIKK